MIRRDSLVARVHRALRESPVVVLLGPRQCGKTTLARSVTSRRRATHFDLEDPTDRVRLAAPKTALEELRGLVVIDEVQRLPDVLDIIRVLVDRTPRRARYLLLGSASPQIVRGASETLAGRAAFIRMGGFDLDEVGADRLPRLWTRGGFPRSFLAPSEAASVRWRDDFISAFLERDIPRLGITVSSEAMRRFWTMVAHYHGQVFNAAEFARSLGTAEATARRYLDILSGSFVVRQLQPWFENISKRQVKSPKVYVRDTGLLHALLSIPDHARATGHPKYGASFEGFGVEQVVSLLEATEAYFWATHSGAELDLLIFRRGRRLGFEFKCSDAPRATQSMYVALEDLGLDHLYVVYPGRTSYQLDRRLEALSIHDLARIRGGKWAR